MSSAGVLNLDTVSKTFAKLAQSIGVKARGISLHSLRRGAATTALQSGADIRTVSALLGHALPSTTLNVYGHVVAGAKNTVIGRVGDLLAQAQARHVASEKRSG